MTASIAGREPPNCLDSEATVLAAVLAVGGRDALDECATVLEAGHFYSEANATIWRGVVDLAAKGSPIDVVLVRRWLTEREQLVRCGGVGYLAQLTDATPAVFNLRTHALAIRAKAQRRAVIAACQAGAARGYTGADTDAQDGDRAYCEQTEAAVMAACREGAEVRDPETLSTTLSRVFTSMQEGGSRGATTGLVDLDAATDGLRDSDLIIVAARPGMGKTALLDHLEVAVAGTGAWVHSASLEMPADQRAQRKLAAASRIDVKAIRRALVGGAERWSELATQCAALSKLGIVADDAGGQTVEHIRSAARRTDARARKYGARLGLVTVDYLQLCRTRRRTQSREQEVAEVSRQLKELAKELSVPVVATAQLNRDVEKRSDKRPMLSDLRESGQVEQDADVIVFIYRADYYAGTRPKDGAAELIIAKGRSIATGTVEVRFVEQCCRFENATERPTPRDWRDDG